MMPIPDEQVLAARPRIVVDSRDVPMPDPGVFTRTFAVTTKITEELRGAPYADSTDTPHLHDLLQAIPGVEDVGYGRYTVVVTCAKSFGTTVTIFRVLHALCEVFSYTEFDISCVGPSSSRDSQAIETMTKSWRRTAGELPSTYRHLTTTQIREALAKLNAVQAATIEA